MTTHRGFTLVELMVALVLTLAVGGVTYQLLLNNGRVTRAQTEQVSLQDNVRSGALIIGAELREVGYDRLPAAGNLDPAFQPFALGAAGLVRSDVVAFGTDSVRYKAMRGFGLICGFDAAGSRLELEPASLQLSKTLAVGDSILVYVEADPLTAADDLWLHGAVTSTPVNQNCDDGVTVGRAIGVAFSAGVPAATAFSRMSIRGPVRFFEEIVLRSYQSAGETWLGIRSILPNGPIEPVLGPIAGGAAAQAGLAFSWLDVNGNVTAAPANARSVEVTLRGVTDMPVHTNGQGYAGIDSLALTTQVALRNALR
ncbi:MAG: prepilin-type N-terminal cleavage/methylation domain-containing protein [Gemmatimonadales bacterium]|nr:prepilin-type N-terminal cleavage/methylation domain-containing protein [Gemmatimonadales bacterium]MBA3554539.1 prepilin-type N-terminal cleavage/methylation domain-containing protein [Gemmatimonadales bacterium]